MRSLWHRTRALARSDPAVLDAVIATGLLVAALLSLTGDLDSGPGQRTAEPVVYLLVVAGIAPYYVRRRWPLAVLIVAALPVLAMIALGFTPGVLGAGLFVACYTVGAWSPRGHVIAGAAYTAAVLVGIALLWPLHLRPVQLVENLVLFGMSFAFGEVARARRKAAQDAAERAALIEAHQAELARQRALADRLEIAREVHDVVAHSLGVIAVQSGAGAHVFDTDPQEARRALKSIASTSREALGEVRGLLGVLRNGDDGVPFEPHPGLAALDTLVERTRAAGVAVSVSTDGDPGGLPATVDRTAYEILQEALTNVVRHAPGSHADVRLSYQPRLLGIDVNDDGDGPNATSSGSRQGLVGMRERVAMWGGTMSAGPLPDGGFGVHVVLPRGPRP